jgi:hypothetical protein
MAKKKDLISGIESLIQSTENKSTATIKTTATPQDKLVKTSYEISESKLREFKIALASASITMKDFFLEKIDELIEQEKRKEN